MAVRLFFDATFIVSVAASLLMSQPDLFLNDELSIPETAFDQSTLPIDFDLSPQDGSDLSLGGVEDSGLISNNDSGVGDPFELAGCSSSELFPALGKSRMRRRDAASECKNSGSASSSGNDPPIDSAGDPLGALGTTPLFNALSRESTPHAGCSLYSLGVLPVGVCHSGVGKENLNYPVAINGAIFETFVLERCTPLIGTLSICPVQKELYCCGRARYLTRPWKPNFPGVGPFYTDAAPNYVGLGCISLSRLMGAPEAG